MQHLHVADVVDEGDLFQDHNQTFPVHLDSHDHAVEGELAYGGMFLFPLINNVRDVLS